MEIVVSIVAKIAEYSVAPVGRQLGYLFGYTSNVDNLKTQVQHLKDAKDRLQRRVEGARNNCEEIEADVQRWLTSFDEISEKVDTFLNHEDHAKVTGSYCGSVLHLATRHRLSRKAKKMLIPVREACEGRNFETISYPPRIESSFATTTRGYETFDSRKRTLENMMAAVRDGNRRRIGLHGMAGIGKTMLAKEIARRAEEEKLFSKVVIATVSQAPNPKEIQQQIAEKLHLKLDEKDSMGKRADLLRMRLKPKHRILLILDDIWKELDLETIGIHQDCRMLLTSRYLHVLRGSMGVTESNVFLIGVLERSEAISLFRKIIGDSKVESNGDYNALALKIADECAGLPIAIVTVAHALKCNTDSFFIWEDALQRLRSSNFAGVEGMHDKVYLSIRLSYDFLGSQEEEEQAKLLLLLCALHKEDQEIKVEDLMRYFVGWRLLHHTYTMRDTRNRVNSLVVKLKSHCLLLDGKSKKEVKMHDLIRDVCIVIAKEDHEHRNRMMMYNITSAAMYEELVINQRLKPSKAISFVDYDDSDDLPEKLECPSLEILVLSDWSLKSIPDGFFEQTRKLQALSLNNTYLESLPPSFRLLQNLQTLCLHDSKVEDITVIGELKNLKVLDLSSSRFIKRLPKEIGKLRRLQVLDLQGCSDLRVIEPNVISNLTKIEELYLPNFFRGWALIEKESIVKENASLLLELMSLQRLEILYYLSVPSANNLPNGLFTQKLEKYRISIGDGSLDKYQVMRVGYSSFFMDEFSKWLHINISQSDQIYACGLGSLMKKSEYLSLHGLIDVSNIVHDLDKDGFPNVQSLRLTKLRSLESISCPGNKLPRGSFNELRKVDVWHCGRLKNLFPLCVAKLLHHITIGKCERMEEIIVREDGDEVGHNIDDDNHFSLQLRYLKLYDLPNLVQFCSSKQTTTGESSSLLIDHSKPFFNERVSFSKLEELTMWDMNMEKLWPEKLMVSQSAYMPNLASLEVTGCNNLKYLFTFSLAQKFVNLKSIRVEYCEAMEDILRVVKLGEEETQTERIDLFPKLESVRLVSLSSLQRFCIATDSSLCMVFPLLSNLKIEDCPELKTFVSAPTTTPTQASVDHPVSTQSFFNIKVSFPHLEELYLKKSSAITLWPNTTLSSLDLQNLICLEVQRCNRVKYLFSFGMAERLVNLEMLKIDDCVAMEGILKSRKVVVGEERSSIENNTTLFPKLQTLKLKSLQVLKTFCWEDSSLGDGDGDGDDEKIVPKQHFFNGMIAFFNLKELIVEDCKNLKYLLSSAMARSLVQLEKLEVNECENMEEVIVSGTHHNEESPSGSFKAITFEKLESLHLWKLPNLKRFCEGDGIECPMLSKLVVLGCLKLKEFMGGEKEIVSSAQQSLFKHNNKVIFPMLEELETDWSEVIKEVFEMSSNSNSIILFPNLSKLLLTCKSPDEAIGVPNLKLFLHKYHKIHTLELSGSFVNLSSGGNGDGETNDFINNNTTPTSSSLERLKITRADTLDYVFGVESYHTHNNNIVLFPNLTHVSVEGCSRLQSFAPSFMCFPNLEYLCVRECHGLRYLFSSATAAALLQLKNMTIRHCKGMRNMIINNHDHDQKLLSQVDEAEEEQSTDHCLVFQNLKHLRLNELPSLQSFYSGNKVISFPNLEQLYMSKCPEMRRFSNRIINTSASLLKTIKVDGKQETIETDVNTTTTKLFEEDDSDFDQLLAHQTVSFSKLEELSMWEMNIEKLWPVQLVSSSSNPYMQNLTSLEVKRCDSLKYLFTFSLAQKFVNLKSIRVQDCKAMEDIIRVGELGEEESTHDLFPKLRSLNLVKLSALQTICTATESSSCMVFPLLSKLKVEDCPEIKTFVSSPTTIPTQVSLDRRDVNQLLSIQPFSTEKMGSQTQ